MKFRLYYWGPLKSDGKPKDKQKIRRYLLPQLRNLWEQSPLCDQKDEFLDPCYELTAVRKVDNRNFASIVNKNNKLIAELDILLLRPGEPGELITKGGDIDNRLKTLFDALSIPPHSNQIPEGDKQGKDEDPFHCLLEDDSLITGVNVAVDRFLGEDLPPGEVLIIIRIDVSTTSATLKNLAISL